MSIYKKNIEEFNQFMFDSREFGAVDSEPRWVFKDFMRKWAKGGNPQIPTTAGDWQLYSSLEGSEDCAEMLGLKLKVLTTQLAQGKYLPVREALDYYGFLEE